MAFLSLTVQRYQSQADAARAEYEQALDNWRANASDEDFKAENRWRTARRKLNRTRGKTSGPRVLQRPNRPKRPLSAFFNFSAQQRDQARSRGESITPVTEFSKTVSQRWRELSDQQKQSYASSSCVSPGALFPIHVVLSLR